MVVSMITRTIHRQRLLTEREAWLLEICVAHCKGMSATLTEKYLDPVFLPDEKVTDDEIEALANLISTGDNLDVGVKR